MDLAVVADGKPAGTLRIEGRSGVSRKTMDALPKTVELDPHYDALRRIAEDDLPACLNRTLEAEGVVLVAPNTPKAIADLAEALATSKHVKRVSEAPKGVHAVITLAVVGSNSIIGLTELPGVQMLSVDGSGVTVKEKRYEGAGHAVLFSAAERTWYLASPRPRRRAPLASPSTAGTSTSSSRTAAPSRAAASTPRRKRRDGKCSTAGT